ncbi:HTH-type transcriptional repressor NicS [Nonomuraea coxensis DSM 45129]|uniref:HTH-type transcriptional repressor NicS n=1 Tax=Nonomuraea coxensis DSM 45129 TaxID=1122611 RepID=A0ABX8U6Y5_9ACTN|nr:TetR/AcrR family transcriptional regulator [Nonomuraea coxensis]QYC42417.1 HTH-type transcriptional repressor NicS [Nonomuraea coxensis DSM 45129]
MNVSTAVPAPSSRPSPRSLRARDTLMRTAERLYAEHGFAGVSMRMIREAAGQRNNSAVQYHFSSRDELIVAILEQHAAAIERHRSRMVAELEEQGEATPREWIACVVEPGIEHHVELGTPSWYGRFLAQAVVDPGLREHARRAYTCTPSFRRLDRLHPAAGAGRDTELTERHAAMIRLLLVHMSADLETELAAGQATRDEAERAWRRLGDNLVTAVLGLSSALLPG